MRLLMTLFYVTCTFSFTFLFLWHAFCHDTNKRIWWWWWWCLQNIMNIMFGFIAPHLWLILNQCVNCLILSACYNTRWYCLLCSASKTDLSSVLASAVPELFRSESGQQARRVGSWCRCQLSANCWWCWSCFWQHRACSVRRLAWHWPE